MKNKKRILNTKNTVNAMKELNSKAPACYKKLTETELPKVLFNTTKKVIHKSVAHPSFFINS